MVSPDVDIEMKSLLGRWHEIQNRAGQKQKNLNIVFMACVAWVCAYGERCWMARPERKPDSLIFYRKQCWEFRRLCRL